MMCKGADTAIFPKLKFDTDQDRKIEELKKVVMNYSKEGLRTMVFAQLRFTVADYKKL